MTSFRTFSFAVLLALTPLVAHAADPGSCSVSQTSRVDSLLNPVVGGDERFFAASGSPTTLMFLVSTYTTMQEYVAPLPNSATGCPLTGSMATGFKAFYDPLDASKNGLTPIDDNSESYESGFSKFFDPNLYYRSAKTKLDSSTLSPSSPQTVNGWDATNACNFVNSGNRAACVTCVTTVGWYRQDDTHYVLKGAVLNENPPKFVTTRAVVNASLLVLMFNFVLSAFLFQG